MSININLFKRYKNFELNIDICTNSKVIALVGDSGSGKTQTLKCISGIIKPDEGFIEIDGKDYFNSEKNLFIPAKNRKIGYLFQDYALFPHLNVLENLTICINEGTKNEKSLKAKSLLSKFRALDLENKYPKDLSGGEKQRVALARIMSINPEVILLDEPFSALDTNLKWELQFEISQFIKSFDGTVILVTHNIEETYRMCEDTYVINQGKIIEYGNSKKIFGNPKSYYTAKFIGIKNFFNVNISGKNAILMDFNYMFNDENIVEDCNIIGLNQSEFSLENIPGSIEFETILIDIVDEIKNTILILKYINSEKLIYVEINGIDLDYFKSKINKYKEVNVNIFYPIDRILYLKNAIEL